MPSGKSSAAGLSFLKDIEVDFKFVTLGLLIIAGTFGYGFYKITPIQKALKEVIAQRPAVKTLNPDLSYDEVVQIDTRYKEKSTRLMILSKSKSS